MVWLLIPTFGLWWWLVTFTLFCIAVVVEEHDCPGGVLGILLGYLIFSTVFGEFGHGLAWIDDHKMRLLVYIAGYFACGFLWALFRFYWDQHKDRREYDQRRYDFLLSRKIIQAGADHKVVPIPDDLILEWQKASGVARYSTGGGLRKYFEDQKTQIANRMMWWWLSLTAFLFSDIIREFYQLVLEKTRKLFMRIEKMVWRGTESDFREVMK